jgi:tetratricopeptide (TPR) repeat protein
MRNLLIVIATLLGLAGPAWANWRSEIDAGIAAYFSGDVDTAIAHYTKAIELKPDSAEAYEHRGVAYVPKKLYDQAIADFTKAIQLKPDFAVAYRLRGIAYGGKRPYDQAIAD